MEHIEQDEIYDLIHIDLDYIESTWEWIASAFGIPEIEFVQTPASRHLTEIESRQKN